MKREIKRIVNEINPKIFGVDKIKINSLKKLGIGEGNLNFLLTINNKKFIVRINIHKENPNKSKKEFNNLKAIENLGIAPKAFYLHPKDKNFPLGFIILEFLEGKAGRMRKRKYTLTQIKNLANILAKLHLQNNNLIKKENYSYKEYLGEDITLINKYTKNKFDKQLNEINDKIRGILPRNEKHNFGIIHGDICPQNIIENNGKLKLIDWESVCISDPAKDISRIITDMGFGGDNLRHFMKEYLRIRKDEQILERAKIYAILNRYSNFLWEIVRSFEIINKELPKEYLSKTTAQSHIDESKFQFRHLRRLVKVPEFDIDKIFKNKK